MGLQIWQALILLCFNILISCTNNLFRLLSFEEFDIVYNAFISCQLSKFLHVFSLRCFFFPQKVFVARQQA